MKIQPIHNYVLIRYLKETQTSALGIILSDQDQQNMVTYAQVIAFSDELKNKLTVNQKVYCKEYSGTKILIDGQEHKLIEFKDIIAFVD